MPFNPDNPHIRRLKRRLTNATALTLLLSQVPGVVHALQPKQPESNPSGTASLINQLEAKQRVRRPRGGPKVASLITAVDKKVIIASTDNSTSLRQQKKPLSSSTHNLYSSGRVADQQAYSHFASNVSLAKQQAILGKPLEHRGREGVEEEAQGVYKLIRLLEQFAPGEAQMFNKTLSLIKSGAIPNLSISSIEQQMIEVLNHSVASVLQKASFDDLQRIARLDFAGVTNPALASLTMGIIENGENKVVLQLLSEEVNKIFKSHNHITNDDFYHDLSNTVDGFLKDFGGILTLGLSLGTLGAVAINLPPDFADQIKKKVRAQLKRLPHLDKNAIRGIVYGLVVISLVACAVGGVAIATATPDSSPATATSSLTFELTPTLLSTSSDVAPNIIVTPNSVDSSIQSDIPGYVIVVGAVPGDVFARNNPGYRIIQPPQLAYEIPLNEYVDPDAGPINAYKGSVIQKEYLMALFGIDPKATPSADLYLGSWNGHDVKFTKDFKFLVTDGGLRIPVGLPGNWGFTVLIEKDNRLYIAGVDGDYIIRSSLLPLVGFSEDELLKGIKTFLKQVDQNHLITPDILNKVMNISFLTDGRLVLLDSQGKELAYLNYFNDSAPSIVITEIPLPAITMESLGITNPEISTAFKGIETTIHREADGTFSVQAAVYQGENIVQQKYILEPGTFNANSDIKDELTRPLEVKAYKFDTNSNKVEVTLLWQGEKGWHEEFDMSKSDDPTFSKIGEHIYFDRGDILTLLQSTRAYFRDHLPFSQEAFDNFMRVKASEILFQYEKDGKIASIRSTSTETGIHTKENATMKFLNLWVQTKGLDGNLVDAPLIGIIDPQDLGNITSGDFDMFVDLSHSRILANDTPEQLQQLSDQLYGSNPLIPELVLFGDEVAKKNNPGLDQFLALPGQDLDSLGNVGYNIRGVFGILPASDQLLFDNAGVVLGSDNPTIGMPLPLSTDSVKNNGSIYNRLQLLFFFFRTVSAP